MKIKEEIELKEGDMFKIDGNTQIFFVSQILGDRIIAFPLYHNCHYKGKPIFDRDYVYTFNPSYLEENNLELVEEEKEKGEK